MNKKVISCLLCASMISISSLFGCSSSYNFTVVVKNERREGFCDVLVQYRNGFSFQFDVAAKVFKSYDGFFDDPPGGLYVITWINENGDKYSAEADLRKLLSRSFKGHVFFVIDEQNNLIYSASKNGHRGERLFEKTSSGIKQDEDSDPSDGGKTTGNA